MHVHFLPGGGEGIHVGSPSKTVPLWIFWLNLPRCLLLSATLQQLTGICLYCEQVKYCNWPVESSMVCLYCWLILVFFASCSPCLRASTHFMFFFSSFCHGPSEALVCKIRGWLDGGAVPLLQSSPTLSASKAVWWAEVKWPSGCGQRPSALESWPAVPGCQRNGLTGNPAVGQSVLGRDAGT